MADRLAKAPMTLRHHVKALWLSTTHSVGVTDTAFLASIKKPQSVFVDDLAIGQP